MLNIKVSNNLILNYKILNFFYIFVKIKLKKNLFKDFMIFEINIF